MNLIKLFLIFCQKAAELKKGDFANAKPPFGIKPALELYSESSPAAIPAGN